MTSPGSSFSEKMPSQEMDMVIYISLTQIMEFPLMWDIYA
jgi:hypothetical protein